MLMHLESVLNGTTYTLVKSADSIQIVFLLLCGEERHSQHSLNMDC